MSCTERIFKTIATFSTVAREEINEKDELSVIGIDSLRKVDLIVALEDCLEVAFDDSDLDPGQLATVESILALAQKYK